MSRFEQALYVANECEDISHECLLKHRFEDARYWTEKRDWYLEYAVLLERSES